jgi:hypothetical protein
MESASINRDYILRELEALSMTLNDKELKVLEDSEE